MREIIVDEEWPESGWNVWDGDVWLAQFQNKADADEFAEWKRLEG